MTVLHALLLQGPPVFGEGTLVPAGSAAAVLAAMFWAYKYLRDQFDSIGKTREKDKADLLQAVADLRAGLEVVQRNQRTRWTLEHQRIFELELRWENRLLAGFSVPDCRVIAARSPGEGDVDDSGVIRP